jgi:hypothetical protein
LRGEAKNPRSSARPTIKTGRALNRKSEDELQMSMLKLYKYVTLMAVRMPKPPIRGVGVV